jgi:hypothetical protein
MMDFTGDSESEQDNQTACGGPGLRASAKADSSSSGVPSDPGGKSSRDFSADPHANFGASIGDAHAYP